LVDVPVGGEVEREVGEVVELGLGGIGDLFEIPVWSEAEDKI
jgi:hypothetical protein